MAWDTRINPVLEVLSVVIDDIGQIRRIADEAGLRSDRLRLPSNEVDLWTEVLEYAQDMGDDRVDAVLEAALRTRDNPRLRDTIEAYWRELGRNHTVTQPDSSRRSQTGKESSPRENGRPSDELMAYLEESFARAITDPNSIRAIVLRSGLPIEKLPGGTTTPMTYWHSVVNRALLEGRLDQLLESVSLSGGPEVREVINTFLRERPERRAAEQPGPTTLAGYAADTVAGEDELGIAEDVRSLCSVLVAEQVSPPLSVGLFGDWGTGKSFFMQKMRERIKWLAQESATARNEGRQSDYCENVRQITFNAWHYVDANLWASLVARIFDGLVGDDIDEAPPTTEEDRKRQERRREALLARLETTELLAADARRRRDAAEGRLRAKQAERDQKYDALTSLTALRFADVQAATRGSPTVAELAAKAVSETTGETVDPAAALALAREVHGTWSAIHTVWHRLRPAARKQLAVLSVIIATVAVVLLTVGHGFLTRVLAAVVVLIPAATVAIRSLPTVRGVRNAAEAAAHAVDSAVQRENDRLDAELADVGAQIDDAQRQVDAADQEIREADQGRRMLDFIQSRATSEDYRQNLGLIALIRADLARLSTLMGTSGTLLSDEPARIERIILYIDDLDRCPPERVVEVLEAVHLLLAFPLFVVVVGVDARWLLRSLELRYAEILTPSEAIKPRDDPEEGLHWAATPQNYLDKIFQIPFSLHPMDDEGFARLIRSVSGTPQPGSAGSSELTSQEDEDAAGAPDASHSASASAAPDPGGTGTAMVSARPVVLDMAPEAQEISRSTVSGIPTAVGFTDGGRRLAVLCKSDVQVLSLLEPRTGRITATRVLGSTVGNAAFAPDGSLIAVATPRALRIYDLPSGDILATVATPLADWTVPTFSVDSQWISGIQDGRVIAREPLNERERQSESPVPDGTEECRLLRGASAAIVAGEFGLHVFPLAENGPVTMLMDRAVGAIAYSVDGQVLAAVDDGSVRLWQPTSAQMLNWFSIEQPVSAVSLTADGRMLAVASGSHIGVIDCENGKIVAHAYHDGEPQIGHVVFGDDGRTLAAVARDGQIRVWALFQRTENLTSEALKLSEPEVAFLTQLLGLVRTPRAAKRLVNIYRILRASIHGEELDRLIGANGYEPEYPAVLLLLAIVIGFPEQASQIIEGLLDRPASTWPQFLDALRPQDGSGSGTPGEVVWIKFFECLDSLAVTSLPISISPYAEWASRVARYSFRTGRLATRPQPPTNNSSD